MNDGVHPADRVYLRGDASGFNSATKITHDHAIGARRKVVQLRGSLAGSRVQNDVMALIEERLRGRTAQAVCCR